MKTEENQAFISGILQVAKYMQTLPPEKLWQKFQHRFEPQTAHNFALKWKLIGQQLAAEFSEEYHPINFQNLTEYGQEFIRAYTSYYKELGKLTFEAEPFIKLAFQEKEMSYPDVPFQALLKELILLECIEIMRLMLSSFLESPSKKEAQLLSTEVFDRFYGRARQGKRIVTPSTESLEKTYSQVDAIHQKLNWPDLDSELDLGCLSNLCFKVFREHQGKLVSYNSWVRAKEQKYSLGEWKKHAWKDGRRINYPGRGKNKPKS